MKLSSALVSASCLFAAASPAFAHFTLIYPPSATMQNSVGDPQKSGPCPTGTRTNTLTPLKAGETITLRWRETVGHPGHYRIALVPKSMTELMQTPADLKDPVATIVQNDCKSAAIMNPPMRPVIADGVNVHATPMGGKMWEAQVTIPADISCERCTMQIVQFMSDHVPSCFYYHCAEISVSASSPPDGGSPADAAADTSGAGGAGGGAGPGSGGATGGGGSISTGGNTGSGGAVSGSGGARSGGSGSARGGAAGSAPAPSSGDSGGCALGGGDASGWTIGALALAALLAGRSRRRRGERL